MLPSSLFSSYEQYKIDSDFVANWLATTATRCGYKGLDNTTSVPATTGRLKGKARKHARESNTDPSQHQTYRVKIR